MGFLKVSAQRQHRHDFGSALPFHHCASCETKIFNRGCASCQARFCKECFSKHKCNHGSDELFRVSSWDMYEELVSPEKAPISDGHAIEQQEEEPQKELCSSMDDLNKILSAWEVTCQETALEERHQRALWVLSQASDMDAQHESSFRHIMVQAEACLQSVREEMGGKISIVNLDLELEDLIHKIYLGQNECNRKEVAVKKAASVPTKGNVSPIISESSRCNSWVSIGN